MKTIIHTVVVLLFSTILIPNHLIAADYSQGSNIVKFQYKLASKGNAGAQYRLASMLETGDGIAVDQDAAKHWYELAAKTGLKTAAQRNTYLKIKQQGFDPTTDTAWLNDVKTDAGRHKPDAVLLLAQIYRQGFGVEKDLNKALDLFNEVRIRGVADVYEEIASINEELDANDKAQERDKQAQLTLLKEKQQPAKNVVIVPAKAVKQVSKQKQTKVLQAKLVPSQQTAQAEKIKRYERAMLQLKREQALIDAQQAEITGDSAADEI